MANQGHVEILRQGKDAWNEWRKQYPDIEPDLSESYYDDAKYIEFNFSNTNFYGSHLFRANFYGASLRGADLSYAALSHAHFATADLSEARLYRTRLDQPTITVGNLKVAQFIYLLLNNKEIRDVIDTITSKVVLILGRFTDERKKVLDAIRDALRKRNYTPILFDFEKSASRDIT